MTDAQILAAAADIAKRRAAWINLINTWTPICSKLSTASGCDSRSAECVTSFTSSDAKRLGAFVSELGYCLESCGASMR